MKLKNYLIAFISALASATLVQAAETEPKKSTWESSISLGATLTKGNSDTMLLVGNIQSAKKWDRNELGLGADATYGETEDLDTGEMEKTAESIRGFAQYNRLFSEHWFGYLRADALHDDIADINYRITLSPGAGYYFIKNTNTFLRAEIGPGYIIEEQGGEQNDYMTLRIAQRFEHKFSERAKLWQSLEFLPQVDDWENFIINAELGIDTAITKTVSLRAYIQDTYDNEPAPGRDENDLKLIAALAYKF